MMTDFLLKSMPSWGRRNLPLTASSCAVWPTTPNPSMNPLPRARPQPHGPSPCSRARTYTPVEPLPRQTQCIAVRALSVSPFVPTTPPLSLKEALLPGKRKSTRSCAKAAACVLLPAVQVPSSSRDLTTTRSSPKFSP